MTQSNAFDKPAAQKAVADLLSALGQDMKRLQGTPHLVSSGFLTLLSGTGKDPQECLANLIPTEQTGLVVLRDIPFRSLCEHHLLPFFGTVDLLYEPGGFLAGVGCLMNLVHCATRRLGIQEDITEKIAHALHAGLFARRTLVSISAIHTCILDNTGRTEVVTYANRGVKDSDLPGLMRMIRT